MKKITKVLTAQEDNYIFPFLWVHGEDEATIRLHIEKIATSGIRAFCVESRPHPDFLGEKWWHDLAIILNEAKKYQMKVWLLDDAHFPTGYANGAIIKKHPELRKKFLKIKQLDYHGPQKEAGIIVKWHAGGERSSVINVGINNIQAPKVEEKIIAVLAAKIVDYHTVDTESMVNLTDKLHQGIVYWDMPEGNWRVFVLVESFSGGEESTEGYLNPIDSNATQVLIDEVYEAHYQHFKSDFGDTIAGFFSDEPRFGNIKGPNAAIGKIEMPLPWRSDLLELLQAEISEDVLELLPLLVCNGTHKASLIRYVYMDVVTKLYSENFSGKLAEWCQTHQVAYIGHVIEDNNAHTRLGYGAGHFFRAMEKQSMSGIDVVLHQLLPGLDADYFKTFTSTGWDGEFFHYGLGKLGASFGHIDPIKKGRTMVELFGAYGWSEGLNFMKWLADQFLVAGVNHFVPHAFNLAPFPDSDCPPHFYAHGHDLQFPHFKQLMQYMNRCSELLSDGIHIKNAFILYHAEAEWSGEAMLFQKPAKEFIQHQLDFDIIPIDVLSKLTVIDRKLMINQQQADVLVIPYAERLPKIFFESLQPLLESGAEVIFLDGYPVETSEGNQLDLFLADYIQNGQISCVLLSELANVMQQRKYIDIQVADYHPLLRFYHYRQKDGDVYLFINASSDLPIETNVFLQEAGFTYEYQALTNQLFEKKVLENGEFHLSLAPQESTIFVISKSEMQAEKSRQFTKTVEQELLLNWQVTLDSGNLYPQTQFTMTKLENIASPSYYPDFSGVISYTSVFEVKELLENQSFEIDLGDVYEIATVIINNQRIATKIAKPYKFDVTEYLTIGENKLTIQVINTLGTSQQDYLSQYRLLQPSGLLGPVKLIQKTR